MDVYAPQSNDILIHSARTAVTLDLPSFLRGDLNITTAQLFGLRAKLTRKTPDAPLNIQYIIDAFSSDDEEETHAVNLKVSSLILRHVHLSYDVLSEQKKDGTFDPNHLNIDNIGLTASIKALTEDSLNVVIRRLNFTERHSGLTLKNLETSLAANSHSAVIDSIRVQTGQSTLRIDKLNIDYPSEGKYTLTTRILPSQILPAEFAPLRSELGNLTSPIRMESAVEANEQRLSLRKLVLHADDQSLQLHSDLLLMFQKANEQDSSDLDFLAQLHQLNISAEGMKQLLTFADMDESAKAVVSRIGKVAITGQIQKESEVLKADLQTMTDAGDLSVNGEYKLNEPQYLSAHIQSENLSLKDIAENEKLGQATFSLDVDGELSNLQHPTGNVYGEVEAIDYNGYTYNHILIDGTLSPDQYTGYLSVDDEHLQMVFDGNLAYKQLEANLSLSVRKFEPHALNLTQDYADETFRFNAVGNISGNDLASAIGEIVLDSIAVHTPEQTYTSQAITIRSDQLPDEKKRIQIVSDFLDANFVGNINYPDIIPSFQNQLAQHLPSLIGSTHTERQMDTAFDFTLELTETPLIQHFIDEDILLLSPAHIAGRLDAQRNSSHVYLDLPRLEFKGTRLEDVKLTYNGSLAYFRVDGELLRYLDNGATTHAQVNALAHNDQLTTHLSWKQHDEIPSEGYLSAKTVFDKKDGQLDTRIHIQPSQLTYNDTTWLVKPADIQVLGKTIRCHGVEVSHRDRYVKVNGVISESPSDSLVVQLNNVDVDYVLSIVDFTAVDFRGRAFGNAYVSNIYHTPRFNAALRVEEMAIGTGLLGVGNLRAHWDDDVNGVRVSGHIVDTDEQGEDRITDCSGYISPADNYINLNIRANNTNASFLNDFLGGVFRDIHGNANGVMNVIGPLNDIGLIGDMSTDVAMTLRATGVTYHTEPQDTLRFRPYRFNFEKVRIYDDEHHQGLVNGFVSHRNVKNFAYEFHIDMQRLMAYEEQEFNSDKFMGKVYSDGWLTVKGADSNPLTITADVTPTRGSFFAYDAATPDAIASSSFITFRDQALLADTIRLAAAGPDEDYEYHGDIFMNVAIHLNPECAIKLRMDNADDGYITTYGSGKLQAFYHNKGSFTLNGTYNILSGRYRLSLQDIIFRDLELQNGSAVVFNGNPFDADIHLICHHTINSVPLSDLTAGMTTTSSNKVKVVCILDITGKLGNMNFKFDLNLPNVNDEIRQLVRSYISTEEDMNKQMIYLLGLGRFYTNEYARSTGDTGGGQAVNTLLSSTISGQINQMLSNVIGTDSKWNFGTGLTTGEQGWNDLDVEGMLSGRLLDDRLLINGNFGYRDNAMTQNASFIGDFDVKWRIREGGNTYLKAYNKTNDRYFTKATLNTQGIGISYQRDFELWNELFRRRMREEQVTPVR